MSALLGRLAARHARRAFLRGDYRPFTFAKRHLRGATLHAFIKEYYRVHR